MFALTDDVDAWFREHGLSTRTTSRRAQLDLAHADDRVFSMEGDLAMTAVPFYLEIPKRYRQMGIAEANMVGAAAGLALRGKIPFVNTFASFVALRACEQVRIDVAYARANVKLIGGYAGLSGGPAGPTHHCNEDIAVMRSMPNMVVLSPADSFEAYKATVAAAGHDGPVYLRVGRAETPAVYRGDYHFRIGRAVELADGSDVAIVSTGSQIVPEAQRAAETLSGQGISCRILNVHTIKPLDQEAVVAAAASTGAMVTVEEHNVLGGLGGAVAELVLQHEPVPVVRVGVPDQFCEQVGSHEELVAEYGLGARAIEAAVHRALALKDARAGDHLCRQWLPR